MLPFLVFKSTKKHLKGKVCEQLPFDLCIGGGMSNFT